MQNEHSKSSGNFNMDSELRQALIVRIRKAQAELKTPRVVKVLLETHARKTPTFVHDKRAENVLYERIQRKFIDRRLWKTVQDALAKYGFKAFIRQLDRQAVTEQMTAARAHQLSLFPGFESLPTRIRNGSKYVSFPETSVSQFLAYERKVQDQAIRNRRRADELHALAEIVRPLAAIEPDLPMAEAFVRAEAQRATRLTVVPPLPAQAG
jgi:hypothetical protein